MTTPRDEAPLSSDEMLRRAREGLARPIEPLPVPPPSSAPAPLAPPVTPRPARPVVKAPRLRPPPPVQQGNPAPTRVVIAIAIAIALIGAAVAFLSATVASAP